MKVALVTLRYTERRFWIKQNRYSDISVVKHEPYVGRVQANAVVVLLTGRDEDTQKDYKRKHSKRI
jgi:hypothetical protein